MEKSSYLKSLEIFVFMDFIMILTWPLWFTNFTKNIVKALDKISNCIFQLVELKSRVLRRAFRAGKFNPKHNFGHCRANYTMLIYVIKYWKINSILFNFCYVTRERETSHFRCLLRSVTEARVEGVNGQK